MRRSSSTTKRCGALSAGASLPVSIVSPCRSRAGSPRPIGATDKAQHALTILGVDHGGKQTSSEIVGVRPELGQRAGKARRLQPSKPQRQRLAFGRYIEETLPAVVGALLLHDVAFVD